MSRYMRDKLYLPPKVERGRVTVSLRPEVKPEYESELRSIMEEQGVDRVAALTALERRAWDQMPMRERQAAALYDRTFLARALGFFSPILWGLVGDRSGPKVDATWMPIPAGHQRTEPMPWGTLREYVRRRYPKQGQHNHTKFRKHHLDSGNVPAILISPRKAVYDVQAITRRWPKIVDDLRNDGLIIG